MNGSMQWEIPGKEWRRVRVERFSEDQSWVLDQGADYYVILSAEQMLELFKIYMETRGW